MLTLLYLITMRTTILIYILLSIWIELRDARHRRGWSIEQTAEKIGVGTSTYHRWELGWQKPHPFNRSLLTQVFSELEYLSPGVLLSLATQLHFAKPHKNGARPSYGMIFDNGQSFFYHWRDISASKKELPEHWQHVPIKELVISRPLATTSTTR